MNDLIKVIGIGIAIAGVGVAFQGFANQVDSVERKGLTITSGLGLTVAGFVLLSKIGDLSVQLNRT